VRRSLVTRLRPHATGALTVSGFAFIAVALALWLVPVGVGAAGFFLVVTGWLVEQDKPDDGAGGRG
jgi:hypothetical protein